MSHIAEKVRMGEGEEKGTEDSRREEGTKESGGRETRKEEKRTIESGKERGSNPN